MRPPAARRRSTPCLESMLAHTHHRYWCLATRRRLGSARIRLKFFRGCKTVSASFFQPIPEHTAQQIPIRLTGGKAHAARQHQEPSDQFVDPAQSGRDSRIISFRFSGVERSWPGILNTENELTPPLFCQDTVRTAQYGGPWQTAGPEGAIT